MEKTTCERLQLSWKTNKHGNNLPNVSSLVQLLVSLAVAASIAAPASDDVPVGALSTEDDAFWQNLAAAILYRKQNSNVLGEIV